MAKKKPAAPRAVANKPLVYIMQPYVPMPPPGYYWAYETWDTKDCDCDLVELCDGGVWSYSGTGSRRPTEFVALVPVHIERPKGLAGILAMRAKGGA